MNYEWSWWSFYTESLWWWCWIYNPAIFYLFFYHFANWTRNTYLIWTRYLHITSAPQEWEKCRNIWQGNVHWGISRMIGASNLYWFCLLYLKKSLCQRGIKLKWLSCLTAYYCFISYKKVDSIVNKPYMCLCIYYIHTSKIFRLDALT